MIDTRTFLTPATHLVHPNTDGLIPITVNELRSPFRNLIIDPELV